MIACADHFQRLLRVIEDHHRAAAGCGSLPGSSRSAPEGEGLAQESDVDASLLKARRQPRVRGSAPARAAKPREGSEARSLRRRLCGSRRIRLAMIRIMLKRLVANSSS